MIFKVLNCLIVIVFSIVMLVFISIPTGITVSLIKMIYNLADLVIESYKITKQTIIEVFKEK